MVGAAALVDAMLVAKFMHKHLLNTSSERTDRDERVGLAQGL
jgi:hypothetical protein